MHYTIQNIKNETQCGVNIFNRFYETEHLKNCTQYILKIQGIEKISRFIFKHIFIPFIPIE